MMKKIVTFFSLIIILILELSAQNDWISLESGTKRWLESVFFIQNTGYAVGGSSGSTFHNIVLKTTDGGNSWSNIYNPEFKLISTYFTDSETGFAVDYKGILKTANGGESWQRVFDNQSISKLMDLKSIFFVDSQIGYCVGGFNDFNPILKTVDGGKNWINKTNDRGTSLNSCYFLDDKTGYAVGFKGKVIKTIDGGENWDAQETNTNSPLFSFTIKKSVGQLDMEE